MNTYFTVDGAFRTQNSLAMERESFQVSLKILFLSCFCTSRTSLIENFHDPSSNLCRKAPSLQKSRALTILLGSDRDRRASSTLSPLRSRGEPNVVKRVWIQTTHGVGFNIWNASVGGEKPN